MAELIRTSLRPLVASAALFACTVAAVSTGHAVYWVAWGFTLCLVVGLTPSRPTR